MSGNISFTINGVKCWSNNVDGKCVMDLRDAGFVKDTIPRELLNHPMIKDIVLFHRDVAEFLHCSIDDLGKYTSVSLYDEWSDLNPDKKHQHNKYVWKSCEIKTDENGFICLDIKCQALKLNRDPFTLPRWKKLLRRLKMRYFKPGALACLGQCTVSGVEELVIASGEPGDTLTVNVGNYKDYYPWEKRIENFPEIGNQDIILKTSPEELIQLRASSECSTIPLERMTNLQRFLLCAKGEKILPTGMDQLHNLQELFFYDNPLGNNFELSCSVLNLRKLVLFNCGLKSLPSAITKMKQLEVLRLYYNDFQDQSISFCELVKLKRLAIFGCNLHTYPQGLEDHTSLEALNLGDNPKLGKQPFSITGLKNLKELRMSACALETVPDGLENCINLEDLDLSRNANLGKQPFSIAKLKNLRSLDMGSCSLEKFPDGLENCINLEDLDLSRNANLGKQPFSIPKLKNLRKLHMWGCSLEKFPDGLENCINLEDVNLSNANLGKQPFSIPKLKNLRKLHMSSCSLEKFPDCLENCINLEDLNLSDNDNLGKQPFSIAKLKNLRELHMWDCSLEKFPDGLENCVNLEHLDLSRNANLGKLPFSIPKLKNLRKLHMWDCSLEKFPDGLENCINLEVLDLSDNANLGKLPFSIPKLKNLRKLRMWDCSLEKFPDGLENCINLEVLSLSDNANLGKQPFSIPKLKNLRKLYIWRCSLEKFPDGLENCINLEDLKFTNNTIHVLPDAVLELPNLVSLDMMSNRLTELSESFTNLIDRNVKFNLKGNVLGTPPQVICENPSAILKYFQDIAKFGKAHSKRLRLLVIGNTGAGKTSLVNGLLLGESRLTRPEERTEGIEIRKWFPDPANKDLEIEIWDFGGHMEYQTVSHYFMEENSLFLLVVDISEYEMIDESYYASTGKWIDEVKSIVPRPVVVVAATKCDRIDSSLVKDKCCQMSTKIVEQEDMDIKLIESDIKKLEGNADLDDKYRIDKLKLLLRNRPVLPTVFASQENNQYANAKTVIVAASAGDKVRKDAWVIEETLLPIIELKLLKQELFRTGSNTVLFPHLQDTLPSLWVEIEKLLATWGKTKYLKLEELEKWLCEHNQEFKEVDDKEKTLNSILLYLVGLGKVLRFAHLEELKELVFPDPQWLIMLIKDVVHHDLSSHLQYKEVFKACDMDDLKFGAAKKELIDHGLLSESLLRCIWYDAVPKEADFKKLAPLLYHFDVGYEMTPKEAEIEDKEINKRYTFIPALMPETHPGTIQDAWPTHASEDQWETKSIYKFHSRVPVGLFERQMVRCHQGSNYMLHWKEGFLGVYNMAEPEEVTFCITKKTKSEIEFSARIGKRGQLNTLWRAVMQLHRIFLKMVKELWPELRYNIYNKCDQCNQCHHEMDFERLLKTPDSYEKTFVCTDTSQPVPAKVTNKLVFPPKEVVEAFNKEIAKPTDSARSNQSLKISELNANVYIEICTELNKPKKGKDYITLAGNLRYHIKDVKLFQLKDDPADALLSHWGTKAGNDVEKLIAILRTMERDDLVEILGGKKESTIGSQKEQQMPIEQDVVDRGDVSSSEKAESSKSGEVTSKKPILVRDLDSKTRDIICQKLNKKTPFKKDFRGLAGKMKYETEQIVELEKYDNPTEALLDDWQFGNESTVDNLKKMLQKIKRDDVIEILDKISVDDDSVATQSTDQKGEKRRHDEGHFSHSSTSGESKRRRDEHEGKRRHKSEGSDKSED